MNWIIGALAALAAVVGAWLHGRHGKRSQGSRLPIPSVAPTPTAAAVAEVTATVESLTSEGTTTRPDIDAAIVEAEKEWKSDDT